MRRYYRYEEDNIYCKSGFHFPAVYAFYDEYDNLVYIGKSNDLSLRMGQHYAKGHLSEMQYRQVRRVMFCRCKNETDAGILELILLAYHKPIFNTRDKKDLPTIVSVEDILRSLNWECYFDDRQYSSEEKNELFDALISFESWSDGKRIDFLEGAYKKYIVRHKNDSDEKIKGEFEDLFEMVLVRYIGDYRNCSEWEHFCRNITEAFLPDLEVKWFIFCRKRMNQKGFMRYGDVYRAFAHNYYASPELVEYLEKYRWVTRLYSYWFEDKDESDYVIQYHRLMNMGIIESDWRDIVYASGE